MEADTLTLCDLPDEILLHIFEYVLSKDQEAQGSIMPLYFVNKRWYGIVFTIEVRNRCLIYTAKDFVNCGYWELLKWCFRLWGYKSETLGGDFCDWIQSLSDKYHKDPALLMKKALSIAGRSSITRAPWFAGCSGRRLVFIRELEREIPQCWYCEDWGHKHHDCLVYRERNCALCDLTGHPEWNCKYLRCFVQNPKIRKRFRIDTRTLRWANSITKSYAFSSKVASHKAFLQTPDILEAMKDFKIVVCWICNEPGHPAFKCSNSIARRDFFGDKEVQNVLYEYAKKKWGIV